MLDYEGVDNDNDDMCGAEDSAEEDKKEMCIQVTRKGLEKKTLLSCFVGIFLLLISVVKFIYMLHLLQIVISITLVP